MKALLYPAGLCAGLLLLGGEPKNEIILSNGELDLRIEPHGGHFTGVWLPGHATNPLSWALTPAQMPENNRDGAPFKGHFLCLGRWGSPSPEEVKAGIPHNGEQSNTWWEIGQEHPTHLAMNNEAPLDGLTVSRTVTLMPDEPAFVVREEFINTFSLGRVSNVVQHVTIGPPFLSIHTLVNANAGEGFDQKHSYPDPHAQSYTWPYAKTDAQEGPPVDLRRTDRDVNYVSTHLFDPKDRFGWVTAYDPTTGLVLGYVWRLAEYPWINIWNHFVDGKPAAKGLEFGTTGIGRPYRELLSTDTRFHGMNSWEYIEAGETLTKTYLGFMVNIGPAEKNPALTITPDQIRLNGSPLMKNPLGTIR